MKSNQSYFFSCDVFMYLETIFSFFYWMSICGEAKAVGGYADDSLDFLLNDVSQGPIGTIKTMILVSGLSSCR